MSDRPVWEVTADVERVAHVASEAWRNGDDPEKVERALWAALADVRKRSPVAGKSEAARLLTDLEVEDLPALEWLVAEMIPQGSLGVLFGPPESYKTFLALYIALCVATGFEFFGREVAGTGSVVFVSGEGRSGLGARVRAWKRHRHFHGLAGLRFLLEPVALPDPSEVEDFVRLLDTLDRPPSLVVFDTLARCMAGWDENSTGDMGAAVAGMDRVRAETGATTLALHHSPHEGRRERGSTALRGAADVSIGMRAEDGIITVECAKMKDAAHFDRLYLEPLEVEDSVVLVGAKSALHLRAGELTESQVQALHSLHLLAPSHGLTATQWEEVSELERRTYYYARKCLVEAGYVVQEGEKRGALYTVTPKGAERLGAKVQEGANGAVAPSGAKVQPQGGSLDPLQAAPTAGTYELHEVGKE